MLTLLRLLVLVVGLLIAAPVAAQIEQSQDYVPKADVLLIRKGRIVAPYNAVPNTDAARGQALLKARNAATLDGDLLVLGPGTFDIGTSYLDLSRSGAGYIHLKAENPRLTIISSSRTGGGSNIDASILHPGSNTSVFNVGVLGNLTNGDYQGIVGADVDTQSAFTNALFHNCIFWGQSDSFYVAHTTACTASFHDCQFYSSFDAVFINNNNSHLFKFWNCYWNTTGPNLSVSQPGRCRTVRVSQGIVQIFGGEIVCIDGGATDSKAVNANSANATIELYGGVKITSTNSGAATPYALFNSSGSIKVSPGVTYTAATSGAVTFMNSYGVTPSATGIAMLSAIDAAAGRTAIGAGVGSVTSVGLTLPNLFSVSGSPVTSSGSVTASLANQSANQVFAGPTSGSAAPPTFRGLVDTDTPKLFSMGGVRLTGVAFRNAFLGNSSVGNNEVYTCPSGKRAACIRWTVYNGNASTDAVYPTIKVSGTTYRIGSSTNVLTSNYNVAANMPAIVLEAGETIGMNHSQTTANTWVSVVEFDNTCPLRTVKLLTLSSGENTLYTASGVSAYLLDSTLGTSTNTAIVCYCNASGGARNAYVSIVPSGGSPGSTNKAAQTTSVSDGARQTFTSPATLGAGDFISLNTDAATSTQVAWVNVVEF